MFGVSHGALQFMAYEELKRRANEYKGLEADAKLVSFLFIRKFFSVLFLSCFFQI